MTIDPHAELNRIQYMLAPDEQILMVERQSRVFPGGSLVTPNPIIATNKRLIIRNPFALGLKSDVVDIPYEVITSVFLRKGVFTSTIELTGPALVNRSRLGLLTQAVQNIQTPGGIILAINKKHAEQLVEIIRRGIREWRISAV